MITEWGMSNNLKPIKYVEKENGFASSGNSHLKVGLDEINNQIEKEIEELVDANYKRAYNIILENWDKMEVMAEALMKHETIDKQQIQDIMEGSYVEETTV